MIDMNQVGFELVTLAYLVQFSTNRAMWRYRVVYHTKDCTEQSYHFAQGVLVKINLLHT